MDPAKRAAPANSIPCISSKTGFFLDKHTGMLVVVGPRRNYILAQVLSARPHQPPPPPHIKDIENTTDTDESKSPN
jgi:hypothetical protein